MGASTTTATADDTKKAQQAVRKKPARKALAARPYRRLEKDVLSARTDDVRKKLAVHNSKIVLLKDKLEQYEREAKLRDDCEET